MVKRISTLPRSDGRSTRLAFPVTRSSALARVRFHSRTSSPFLISRSAIGCPMRPMPIQPSVCRLSPMLSLPMRPLRPLFEVGGPVACFQNCLHPPEEARRIGAVESAVIEALGQHAERSDGDALAILVRDH